MTIVNKLRNMTKNSTVCFISTICELITQDRVSSLRAILVAPVFRWSQIAYY